MSLDLEIGSWTSAAACRDADPALFFPETTDAGDAALTICSTCLVQQQCRTYARTANEPAGIWGGERETTRANAVRQSSGPITVVCTECDHSFEAADRRQRLCSDECRRTRRRKTVAASNRRRAQKRAA